MKNRVELHCHTKMTEMEGVADVYELIRKAREMGMPAIAITDQYTVQAFPEAYHAWKMIDREHEGDKHDPFKVLYGLEAYMVDDQDAVVKGENGQFIDTDYVVVDLETTGFSSAKDRIIEVGAVRISDGKITERFSSFVNPGMEIPEQIVKITGISNEMVAGADPIEVVLPKLMDFCNKAILVAHNAKFDASFIRENMKKLGIGGDFTTIDTLNLSRILLKDLKRHSLREVATALKIPIGNLHRASDDAELTAEIFLHFLEMVKMRKIDTWHELNEHAKKNYHMTRRIPGRKIIIIATSGDGIKNLYELISEVSLESFDYYLKIPKSLLEEKRNGLIIGSCAQGGHVSDAVFNDDSDDNIRELVKFYDFVEVEPVNNYIYELGRAPKRDDISAEEIQEKLKRLIRLCEEEGVPAIASANVYYVEKSDIEAFKVLRHSIGFRDTAGWKAKHHLMSAEDLLAEFDYLGKETSERIVIDNPNLIAEKIGVLQPISSKKQYPVYPDADQDLKKLCFDKAHDIYGEKLPSEVEDRMEYEYAALKENGYTSLYMIAHELVKRSNEAGYLVGARGCSCASLIAYLAGITEINPLPPHYVCKDCGNSYFDVSDIKGFQPGDIGPDLPDKKCPVCGKNMSKDGYDIPVETFLGFNMDKEPDFDLNFSGEYQKEAQRSVVSIKGVGTILRAGTIGTLAEKTALSYAKTYFKEKKSKRKQESIRRVAKRIEGVKRRDGVHPGGIIVIPRGVEESEYTPVLPSLFDPIADPIPRTEMEYHAIDGKLLKLDILGHNGPTFLKRLKEQTGVDPRNIPIDDKGVISLLSDTKALDIEPEQIGGVSVGTLGIPCFGDGFAIGLISDTKPHKLSDMIRIMGLSHGTGVWHGNAEIVIKEGKADLAHCLCNRDDIMIYLVGKGLDSSISFNIMESVRKGRVARGKDRNWDEWRREMMEHNVPDWYIECCEKVLYMFPKAHSAAYSLTAYRLLYYKLYYPKAFYRTWLEFAVIDKSFVDNGPDYARYVLEELKKKNPGRLGHKQQSMLDEIPVVLEMFARGVTI